MTCLGNHLELFDAQKRHLSQVLVIRVFVHERDSTTVMVILHLNS